MNVSIIVMGIIVDAYDRQRSIGTVTIAILSAKEFVTVVDHVDKRRC